MFRRNLWTGELEEVSVETENGRAIIFRSAPPTAMLDDERLRHVATYQDHKPLTSVLLGCHTSQIEEFNKRAHDAGRTDVEYVVDPRGPQFGGVCHLRSRGEKGRNGELKARQQLDGDAGFGDHAGS